MTVVRILIADKFEPSGVDGLTKAGCTISYKPGLKDDALAAEVAEWKPDVLIVRSTKVPARVLAAGPLKLVVRAGAGYNTIDVAAASERGIYVSNCPGKNSIAVAELAFGLIVALDRRIADNVLALRDGKWNKAEFSKAGGLFGKTLGLIGLGRIGQEMIPRAHGFGMKVIAWSRSLTPEKAAELGIGYQASPEALAAASDVLSVHLALTPSTRGLLGREFFAALQPGAIFINTARAEVVDQAALADAVREKRLRIGLDVYANEPAGGTADFAEPLAAEPGVYGTHHIGASTNQAQEAIAAETVRIVKSFNESGRVPNVVNLARSTPATCTLVVRQMDRPGVLAGVLDAISAERINVQEMENIVFEGAQAAVARINLEREPSQETIDRLRQNPDILEISVLRI